MADWRDFEAGNHYFFPFVFKGGLDSNRVDPLIAYTLGDQNSWISLNSVNLQHLLDQTEKKSKQTQGKKKNNLIISVPSVGGLARWFDVLKNPKNKLDILRILVYSNANQKDLDYEAAIRFNGIKLKGSAKPARLFNIIPMAATFYTFEYRYLELYKS